MAIIGTFNTYDNEQSYTLNIGIAETATITDPTESNVIAPSPDLIVMFGTDPISIQCDRQDLMKRIIISQATINLVSNKNMTGLLYANNNREIPVTITNSDNDTVFFGYVDPLQFNQGFAHQWERIKISATDPLGALEELNVGDLADVEPVTTITTSELIVKIFETSGILEENVDMSGINYTVLAAMDNTVINMAPFFGDSEDDWMTLYDALENICKYFNLYVAYYNNKAYITCTINFHPNAIGISNFEELARDASTSISVDDVYSQVNLTVDIEPVDDTIASLLDDDQLYSDYNMPVTYMKEAMSYKEDLAAVKGFKDILWPVMGGPGAQGLPPVYDDAYVVANQCYVKRNNAWSFNNNSYITHMGGAEIGPQGTPVKMTGDQDDVLTWLKGPQGTGKAAFISFGRSNKIPHALISDDNMPNNPTMKDYFVISINGNGENDQRAIDGMQAQIQSNQPICSFKSLQNYNLTPTDENSITYIVIQGKILLNPLQELTGPYWDSYYQKTTNKISDLEFEEGDGAVMGNILECNFYHNTVPNPNNEWMYYQQYWTKNQNNYGLHGYLDNSGNKKMKYTGTQLMKDNDTYVNISKVPILCCELKVGDKYCVEMLQEGESGVGDFQWLTNEQCQQLGIRPYFTIGIGLNKDDYIVGQSNNIQDNTNYKQNIDISGTAIPIRMSDHLNGDVQFKILGPFNALWDEGTGIVLVRAQYDHNGVPQEAHDRLSILQNIQSIMIEGFDIKVTTNNGGTSREKTSADNDLVYASDMNPAYKEKLEEDLNIGTPLTAEECDEWGIKYQISNSYIYTTDEEPFYGFQSENVYIKPEECLVDYYYNEYNTPAKIIETCMTPEAFANGLKGNQLTSEMLNGYITGIYPGDAGAYRIMNYDTSLKYKETNISFREYKTYNHTQI